MPADAVINWLVFAMKTNLPDTSPGRKKNIMKAKLLIYLIDLPSLRCILILAPVLNATLDMVLHMNVSDIRQRNMRFVCNAKLGRYIGIFVIYKTM